MGPVLAWERTEPHDQHRKGIDTMNATTHTAQYAAAVVGARVRSFCALAHPGPWQVLPITGMTVDHKPGPRRRVPSP